MTNQTSTSGGANVDGNVNVKNGDAVLRDKNIYYITVVGNLLSWAEVEGLIPKVEGHDFSSLAQAVEGALNTQLNKDLTDSIAFAGEILEEFIDNHIPDNLSYPVRIREMIRCLPSYIYSKLHPIGFWDEHSAYLGRNHSYLLLDSTYELYKRHIDVNCDGFMMDENSFFQFVNMTYTVDVNIKYPLYELSPQSLSLKELKIILMGVVLDLVRIKAQDKTSFQFLQQLSNLFKAK